MLSKYGHIGRLHHKLLLFWGGPPAHVHSGLPKDLRGKKSVNLTAAGRKRFFQMYEQRMTSLLTHPLFEYKVSYRRALELQARMLAKALTGEVGDYTALMTR